MKTLLIMLALCCSFAHAAPPTEAEQVRIAKMVEGCSSVMGREVCRVALLGAAQCKTNYSPLRCRLRLFKAENPNGLLVAGAGRFSSAEYFQYVDADDKMCDVIVRNCQADFTGRGCMMARALWNQWQ